MKIEVSVYLDFLRFAASLAVFLGHSYSFTGETWGSVLAAFRNDAVAIFFVISGFVIAYVTSGREKTLEQYTIARLARLYSVAVPAVVLTLICDNLGLRQSTQWYVGRWWFNADTTLADVARYLTFTNEYWNAHVMVGSDEPYWSIGYEASYYIIYAVIAFPLRHRLLNTALILTVCTIFGPKILSYLPLWMIGVLTYHLSQKTNASQGKIPSRIWLAALGALPVAFAMLKTLAHYHPDWQANIFEPFQFSKSYFAPVLYYTAIGVLTGSSIVAISNLTNLVSGLARVVGRPIRWLAGGTFTLYLLHQPILLLLVSTFPGNPDTVARAAAIQLTTLVAVYGISEFTERRKTPWIWAISALFAAAKRLGSKRRPV